jgi:hypothetical protein
VNQQALILASRITDYKVNPTRVAVGETVTIAGTLQWHTPILCWWNPLEGRKIEVIADTAKLGETASGSGGGFRFTWSPTTVGTYWIKARFPGNLIYNACESQTVRVDVITTEKKREEEMWFWGLVGTGVFGTLIIIGMVLYHVEEMRRMELLLARRR